LSVPGALEALATKAGLKPERATTVSTTMSFPDVETATKGLLASGVAERAVRNSGEAAARAGIGNAIQPSRKPDGSYSFTNEWRFLLCRA
jgi:hypothetical protein